MDSLGRISYRNPCNRQKTQSLLGSIECSRFEGRRSCRFVWVHLRASRILTIIKAIELTQQAPVPGTSVTVIGFEDSKKGPAPILHYAELKVILKGYFCALSENKKHIYRDSGANGVP